MFTKKVNKKKRSLKNNPQTRNLILQIRLYIFSSGFLHKYKSVMTSLGFWPALGDVAGAADNILRLWNVYELKVKDIINGEIASTMSRPMKKNEIEFITQTAKNLEMVYYHLSLLSELYNRTEDEAEKENYRKRLNKEYYLVCSSKLFQWMLKHHISQLLKEIFIIGIMVLI